MHHLSDQVFYSNKHLREVHHMYRCLVEHSPDAIVLHCHEQFIYANPAAVQLFGVKDENELLSHSLFEFIPCEERQVVAKIIAQLQNQSLEMAPLSLQVFKLDKTKIDVEVMATSVAYGGHQIVQGMLREVTEKKFVQELQNLNREWGIFRELVGHLADKTLNPLTVIRGFLELLKEGSDVSVDLLLQEAKAIDDAWNRLIELSQRDMSDSKGSPLRFFGEK
ncbi:PAS domain S-box protein [Alicyclobacillus sp. SO9]|uniref:PAS domain S-box protein n=1 Tax=Alicyclobacillus sp. SO9 TaxID=2665646 RepID=UPI0018E8BACF|nr:PAS domain S-box protein [Alicyclobacillus sp. SO9]